MDVLYFLLEKPFISASAPLFSIEFCTLRFVSHSNITKTGENRELVLLEKTLGYLDRNGSTRFQNVWKFSFNLLWTLSIIAIMDAVHDTLRASIKP
jgi:hypothetical protein